MVFSAFSDVVVSGVATAFPWGDAGAVPTGEWAVFVKRGVPGFELFFHGGEGVLPAVGQPVFAEVLCGPASCGEEVLGLEGDEEPVFWGKAGILKFLLVAFCCVSRRHLLVLLGARRPGRPGEEPLVGEADRDRAAGGPGRGGWPRGRDRGSFPPGRCGNRPP